MHDQAERLRQTECTLEIVGLPDKLASDRPFLPVQPKERPLLSPASRTKPKQSQVSVFAYELGFTRESGETLAKPFDR